MIGKHYTLHSSILTVLYIVQCTFCKGWGRGELNSLIQKETLLKSINLRYKKSKVRNIVLLFNKRGNCLCILCIELDSWAEFSLLGTELYFIAKKQTNKQLHWAPTWLPGHEISNWEYSNQRFRVTFGSDHLICVSGKPPTYPFTKPTFCLK